MSLRMLSPNETKLSRARESPSDVFHERRREPKHSRRLQCLVRWSVPIAYFGGTYGSGVPGLIGGYFCKLASSSRMIFSMGCLTQLLAMFTSRCSFESVRRLIIFGKGSFCGGSYMFSCQNRCIFQLRHLTADKRSDT